MVGYLGVQDSGYITYADAAIVVIMELRRKQDKKVDSQLDRYGTRNDDS